MTWLITHSYRLHRRPADGVAIHMDVGRGTRSVLTETHPVDWLSTRQAEWDALKAGTHTGEAMTDIVVVFAIEKRR